MNRKHKRTLQRIFAKPTTGTIKWSDIESLFKALGAHIEEREGSRIAVELFGQARIFHRPHPSPETDKGAIVSIKRWFKENEVTPDD